MERIQGRLPTQVDLIRTVAGLALPVRCTIANINFQALPVGSCSYQDLCKDIVQDMCGFNAPNCPPELADWGIDCNCPFNIPIQTVDGPSTFDIPDFSSILPEDIYPLENLCQLFFIPFVFGSFIAQGDFDVKISVNNAANQHVACFRFLFSMMKA